MLFRSVPPVLLPGAVQRLSWLSPVEWLRQAAAGAMGYETAGSAWVCLILACAGMAAGGLVLYRREVDRQEVAQ